MAACSGGKAKNTSDAMVAAANADAALQASLPGNGQPQLGEHGGVYLSDVDSCGACHPDAFAQQQASAHAFASFNNPVYRMAVEALRSSVGAKASEVCAGCHDAALLADGAMQGEVAATDARAHNGVSCRLCHGIDSATFDGNGLFTLDPTPLPIPRDGDAESLERHRAAVAPAPVSELCGSCHQSFLSKASGNEDLLVGQNDLRSWADSAYTGQGASRIDSVTPADCVDCHMPKVAAPLGDVAAKGGRISSHQSLGGNTWLAAMRTDPVQQAQQAELLAKAVTLDVISSPQSGREIALDVVIRNTGVGHRFPGGVRDAANTRVQVSIRDAEGKLVLESLRGADAHVLRSYVADIEGKLVNARETHQFAAPVADHTIAPRDVAVVRYRGQLAKGVKAHSVLVELVHQSRSEEVARASCAESKSARGKAFARAALAFTGEAVDACVPQPVTVIAKTEERLGANASGDFQRMHEHGLGLLHELQERVGSAEKSLQTALAVAQSDVQRAMANLALGQLASRQGRVDAALTFFRAAEGTIAPHPAIFASRGDAFAKVWRWPEAAEAYAQAVALAPGNSSLWRRYAVALGSAGQSEQALEACARGLQRSPRDPDLLRVQALALRGTEQSQAAMTSYLDHRGPDNRSTIIKRCTDRSAQCARESLPVHEHSLGLPGIRRR